MLGGVNRCLLPLYFLVPLVGPLQTTAAYGKELTFACNERSE